MIAVSSFRPKEKCAEEIWRNQVNAKKSWDKVFSDVIYFGWPPDPELTTETTIFIEWEEFPKIRDLCECCGDQKEMTAIINADIVVAPKFKQLSERFDQFKVQSAVSKRFQFEPGKKEARIEDEGLDIFIALPQIWRKAMMEIPEDFRIGHILWDTWMLSFFYHNAHCYDFTKAQTIFHPKHENRLRPHTFDCKRPNDKYLHRVRYPLHSIS